MKSELRESERRLERERTTADVNLKRINDLERECQRVDDLKREVRVIACKNYASIE